MNVVIVHSVIDILLVSLSVMLWFDTEHIRGSCPGKVIASGSVVIEALLTGQQKPSKLQSVHEQCVLLA